MKTKRNLISSAVYTKKNCPRCKGQGYWLGGGSGDVMYECNHTKEEWYESTYVASIVRHKETDLVQCKLTKKQRKELEMWFEQNDIEFEFST